MGIGMALNPETITVLDPACGSGHILVEAYEVLKGIYLERGYRLRDIPRLILEKNLYGLDIDDRAAQLAGFALLMKARADDRRLLDNPPKLNVLALQESKGLDADAIVQALFSSPVRTRTSGFGDDDLFPGSRPQMSFDESMALKSNNNVRAEPVEAQSIRLLIDTFAHAKTFGSLIQIPQALNVKLATMAESLQQVIRSGDLLSESAAQQLLPLVEQASVLGMQFDAVVANPPYMGGKGMNVDVKDFAKKHFPDSKSDLFAMFIERGFGWCKPTGFNSMVTMQSWMFLSSYEAMREKLLGGKTLSCMVHMGNGVMGIAFGTAATVLLSKHVEGYEGSFCYCENGDVNEDGVPQDFPVQNDRLKTAKADDFKKIPGSPVAYWVGESIRNNFANGKKMASLGEARRGLSTGSNEIFIRYWHEVSMAKIGLSGEGNHSLVRTKKWFPYNKGGGFRRWYGNNELIVNWDNDGHDIKNQPERESGDRGWRDTSCEYYFKNGITWGGLTSAEISFRWSDYGAIFDTNKGPMMFPSSDQKVTLGFLSSKLLSIYASLLNPTLSIQNCEIDALPIIWDNLNKERVRSIVERCICLSKNDWQMYEQSWEFSRPFVFEISSESRLPEAWGRTKDLLYSDLVEIVKLEEENNRLFIEAYGLQDELSPDVPEDQITLARANREKDCQRLISYAIGCMMGRYSLDEPGLIYAHAGNVGFDATRYQTFPADADGIVPLTDEFWFEDDAANRIREFLLAVWGSETLEENMAWLAESLGIKGNETPEETIRRYLAGSFFKNHLQTYKKRPIYWLFSSGKQGAFQAIVYLHRYHEGTLARMRAEYVVPLTSKIQLRIDMLTKDAEVATVTSARNKINKEIEALRKKHVELLAYDEKLRHYADMRIQLDLDDGVKVNYGKFGDLLAEVKAVTGGSGDE
jgi:hypothetical protein